MTLPNAKTPKQEPRPLSLVEEKRQQSQHDLDHWSKVAALPELSTKAAEWARNAARSAAAEVKLRERALAWAKLSQQQKLDQSKADHQKWLQVAARPGLSPEAVEFATNAARSSGAAAKLYKKALAWEKLSPEEKLEQAKAHEQKSAKFAVPLAKLIEARQLSKARRAETIGWLLEQAHQK